MFKCPECAAKLPEFQKSKGSCPYCDAQWDSDQSSEETSDPTQTLNIDQMEVPPEEETAAGKAFDAGKTINLEQFSSESEDDDSNIGGTVQMPQDLESSNQDNDQTVELDSGSPAAIPEVPDPMVPDPAMASPDQTVIMPDDVEENPPPVIDQTVVMPDGDDASFEIQSSPASDDNSADVNQTVDLPSDKGDSPNIQQTMDLSAEDNSGTEIDRTIELPQGQAADADAGQTLDLGEAAGAASPGQTVDLPSDGSDIDRTMELEDQGDGSHVAFGSQPLSPSGVKKYWADADDGSATPMTSLKTATVSKGRDLGVEIPERMIVDKEDSSKASDYRIIDILGEGGMGTVYAADQLSVRRRVAIKTLKRGKGEKADDRTKFLTEAILTGFLDHPNIVPIHELGQTGDGSLFYSMKLVSGTPWNEIIRKKTEAENLDYLMRTADAMAFAHSRNVIHRDLKPENIMLGEYGEVLVMDWGLAVDLSRNEHFNMGGTPAYMAPEMAKGPLERIGKTSDIYLLGAVLYEIVTGYPPHAAKTVTACLIAAAQNTIVRSDSKNKLKQIALKAMSTSPKLRYNSVASFQEAIREYQSHAQSLVLSVRAASDLDQAKTEKSYELFSRAIFAFRDATDLWAGNDQARKGLKEARLAYAQCAFEKEDFDLGIQNLDPGDPDERPLFDQLTHSSKESKQRTKRLRTARLTAVGLILVSLLGALGGIVVVNGYRNQAVELSNDLVGKNETLENQKNQIEEDSKKIVEQNSTLQEQYVKITTANATITKNIKDIQTASDKISKQNTELEQKQDELSESLVATTEAKNIAVAAEIEANTQRKLAEFNGVFSSVGLAQSKIEANDIGRALDLLNVNVPAEFRGWEWKHLYHRCHADASQIEADSAITAVDVSDDGTMLIYGTSSGTVHLVNRNGESIGKPLIMGECSIRAVQFSPDGTKAVIGSNHGTDFLAQWDLKSPDAVRIDLSKVLIGSTGPFQANFVQFAANGDAFAGINGYLIRVSADKISSPRYFRRVMNDSAISPDDKKVIALGQDLDTGRADVLSSLTWEEEGTVRLNLPNVEITAGRYLDNQYVALGTKHGQFLLWDSSTKSDPILARQYDSEVTQIQYDQNSNMLAAVTGSSIELWKWDAELKTLSPYKTLRGHLDLVTCCVFADGGKTLISGSIDKTVRSWDHAQYRDQLDFPQEHNVLHASFSSDGSLIATGDFSGACRIWDRSKPNSLPQIFQEGDWLLEETKAHFNAVYSSDGKYVCTQISGVGVFVWDVQSKRLLKQIPIDSGSVSVTALSNSSLFGVLDSTAGDLLFVNPVSEEIERISLSGNGLEVLSSVNNFAVSPSRENVAITRYARIEVYQISEDRTATKRWEQEIPNEKGVEFIDDNHLILSHSAGIMVVDLVQEIPEAKLSSEGEKPMDFEIFPDRNSIAMIVGESKSVIKIWNPKLDETKTTRLDTAIQRLSIRSDGKSLVLSSKTQVYLWDLQQPKPELQINTLGKGRQITGVECSPTNNNEIMVFYTNKDVEKWDLDKKTILARLNSSRSVVFTDLIENDTKLVSVHADGVLRIWDVANGQKIAQTNIGNKSIRGVSINQNLIALAANDSSNKQGSVIVINLDTLQQETMIAPLSSPANSVAWHTHESVNYLIVASARDTIAATASSTLQWFNAETGKAVGEPFAEALIDGEREDKHNGSFQSVVVSANGKYLAATSSDKKVRIWVDFDPNDMSKARSTSKDGHSTTVTAAAFSKSGDRLVTGSEDRSLIVWLLDDQKQNQEEAAPGAETKPKEDLLVQEVLPLHGHRKRINSIVFSPDQQELLTSGSDNQSIVWLSSQKIDKQK
ncbi:MAG: hypothetical protein COA78_22980 [Blastopirellula sp.]|nr:MAG: hypothetical protein COA78_22980 [Blastopirellula sp.]